MSDYVEDDFSDYEMLPRSEASSSSNSPKQLAPSSRPLPVFEDDPPSSARPLPVFEDDKIIDKKLEIFFIETSGRSCLSARQACGIESAARAHPQSDVTIYTEATPQGALINMTKGRIGMEPNCEITKEVLRQLKNIKVVPGNLMDHLIDTPLWSLHEAGYLGESTSPLVHRSDAVRVALLWKKGGIYLDLDCITLKSLEHLHNTVGTVNDFLPNWLENGVMAFHAEHPFISYLMDSMFLNYQPNNYVSLGPQALTDAMLNFCNRDDLPTATAMDCMYDSTVTIQPPHVFYPISSSHSEVFFKPEADPSDWADLQDSLLVHIYGSSHGMPAPPNSLYAQLAKKYCPISYRMALDTGVRVF